MQQDRLLILGETGALRLEDHALTLAGPRPEAPSCDPAETYAGSPAAAIAHFVERLATGAPFETGPADNLETLRLVKECYLKSGFDSRPGGRP